MRTGRFPTPAGQPIESVRAIRDEIRDRVETLLERVAPD